MPRSSPLGMPISHGMQTSLPRQNYDHRIRKAICESRDPDLFPELDIPNSTIRTWLHRGVPDVITSELVDREHSELLLENRVLRRRVALLGAIVGAFVAFVRVSKTRLEFHRIPEGGSKRVLLRAIERSRKVMPLTAVLQIVGISPRRNLDTRRMDISRPTIAPNRAVRSWYRRISASRSVRSRTAESQLTTSGTPRWIQLRMVERGILRLGNRSRSPESKIASRILWSYVRRV